MDFLGFARGGVLRMYGQAGASGEFGARFEAIGRMDGVDG